MQLTPSKSKLAGTKLEECQSVLEAGLPPPPLSSFKRAVSTQQSFRTHPGVRLLQRALDLDGTLDGSTEYRSIFRINWFLVIFPVVLFFFVSVVAITQGRKAWRSLQVNRLRAKNKSVPLAHRYTSGWTVFASGLVLVVTVGFIITGLVKVRTETIKADLAYRALCTAVKVWSLQSLLSDVTNDSRRAIDLQTASLRWPLMRKPLSP